MSGRVHIEPVVFSSSSLDDEYAVPRTSGEHSYNASYGVGIVTPQPPFFLEPSPTSSDEYSLPPVAEPSPGVSTLRLDPSLDIPGLMKTLVRVGDIRPMPATQPTVPALFIRLLPWTWPVTGTRLPHGGQIVTIGDVVDSIRRALAKPVREDEFNHEDAAKRRIISSVFWERVKDDRAAYSRGLIREDFLQGRDVIGCRVCTSQSNVLELVLSH